MEALEQVLTLSGMELTITSSDRPQFKLKAELHKHKKCLVAGYGNTIDEAIEYLVNVVITKGLTGLLDRILE